MVFSKKLIALCRGSLRPELRGYLLTNSDPARVVALREFESIVSGSTGPPLEVAVVSGSANEPELQFLPEGYSLTLLNYEDNANLFDLTLDWSGDGWKNFRGRFDLVLCEQVLEHLSNPQRAFDNLKLLARDCGVVHVSTPALNNTHGEPDDYFAGFHPRALEHFARQAGLDPLIAGGWASDKGSRMYATCDWSPLAESGPFRFFVMSLPFLVRSPKKFFRSSVNRLRNIIRFPFQPLFSNGSSSNYVVSWVYATKSP